MKPNPESVDVAIIGAGWYGLVAAKTYLKVRPDVNLVILDAESTIGGVWCEKRLYPNLVAQVKMGFFEYTDRPMSHNGQTKNDMVTGEMIHNYLKGYAEDHDITRRIRFNTFVQNASKTDQGWRLSIRTPQESNGLLDTAKLLVCTGVVSIPFMPTIKTNSPSMPIVHSKDLGASFKDLGKDNVQTVVVVGAAKSAYDAVYLLLSMGKRVVWLIRSNGAGPLAILPSEMVGFSSMAIASTRMMTYLSPSILNADGMLVRFFQRSTFGRWFTERVWDFFNMISDNHAGYAKGDHVSKLKPEVDDKSIFWANSGLGMVTLPDFWSMIHSGNVRVVRESIDLIDNDTVTLTSGESFAADYVVMCTGWGDHFAMFDREAKADLGIPTLGEMHSVDEPVADVNWQKYDLDADKAVNEKLPWLANPPVFTGQQTTNMDPPKRWRLYRRAIPLALAEKGDRSLALMGQVHTIQTPLVSEIQSFWSVLYLLGELEIPDYDTMAREIAEWNAWTRKRYLTQGQKFPYSLYDWLPYIDTLCKDMGVNSQRKSNMISELTMAYRPNDFEGFIDEWVAAKRAKASPQFKIE